MPIHAQPLACSLLATALLAGNAVASHSESRSTYHAPRAVVGMRVDGVADEAAWDLAEWRDIKYKWLGPDYSADDFEGRFKLVYEPTLDGVRHRLYDVLEDPLNGQDLGAASPAWRPNA